MEINLNISDSKKKKNIHIYTEYTHAEIKIEQLFETFSKQQTKEKDNLLLDTFSKINTHTHKHHRMIVKKLQR